MPFQRSFRQVDERNVSTDVELMEWSPKMDLIALSNIQGEVILHRLSWQKVWVLPSKVDNVKITALAWRPDGKVLAIGYSSGLVVLADVENAEILHTLDLKGSITTAKWVSTSEDVNGTEDSSTWLQDNSAKMLPKLPSLSKSYGSVNKLTEENIEDSKKLSDQKLLNVLVTGTGAGILFLHIFGIFPAGYLDLKEAINSSSKHCSVLSAVFSENLQNLTVILENSISPSEIEVKVILFKTHLLAHHHRELHCLALKYGQILSLMSYLATTIRSISEAWEDILLEIDSKLTDYAEEKFRLSSGTVSDDFLELLMFGTPTDELEKFLMYDLTEKGLKKLGHSIELSYSNIQKLVLKHLQSVGQAIVYHLSEIKGMALWHEKFGILGLSPDSTQAALTTAGSFMMKATEIQQVIDNSMRNFKAFFRWLYVVILRLSDEPVPSEINKVNQQDLNFVAEFLTENFAQEWDLNKKSSFNLEKVGQYLKKENLLFPPDTMLNPWVKFLETQPKLKTSQLLFPHKPSKSLVQQHEELKEAVNSALTEPSYIMGGMLKLKAAFSVYQGSKYKTHLSQICSRTRQIIYSVITLDNVPSSNIIFIQQDLTSSSNSSPIIKALKIKFSTLDSEVHSPGMSSHCYKILHLQFYNEDILSLLLTDSVNNGVSVLCQMSVKRLLESVDAPIILDFPNQILNHSIQNDINLGNYPEALRIRHLSNVKAHSLAVSGSRKVACVLFNSRRRVRLFEMDVDEEEDETEDTEHDDEKSSFALSDKDQSKVSLDEALKEKEENITTS